MSAHKLAIPACTRVYMLDVRNTTQISVIAASRNVCYGHAQVVHYCHLVRLCVHSHYSFAVYVQHATQAYMLSLYTHGISKHRLNHKLDIC
eukprot:2428-Heterococcus_DN1.PRE.5